MEKLIKDYGLFIVGAIAIYYFFIRKKDEEETSSYKYRGTTTPGFRIAYTKGKGRCCQCEDGSSCCGDCPGCCDKSGGVASHVFPTHSRKKDAPKKSSKYTGFAGNGEPAGLESGFTDTDCGDVCAGADCPEGQTCVANEANEPCGYTCETRNYGTGGGRRGVRRKRGKGKF